MITVGLTILCASVYFFWGFVASWSNEAVATALTLVLAGSLTYLYSCVELPITSISGPAANSKPFRTFKEFWAFYRTQHRESRCRWIHVIGSALLVLAMGFSPLLCFPALPALLFAGDVGCLACKLFSGFRYGHVEIVGAMLIYVGGVYLMHGSIAWCLVLPSLAFLPAAGCHLLGIENEGPTIHLSHMYYPTYSCLGSVLYLGYLFVGWETLSWSDFAATTGAKEPLTGRPRGYSDLDAPPVEQDEALAELGPPPTML